MPTNLLKNNFESPKTLSEKTKHKKLLNWENGVHNGPAPLGYCKENGLLIIMDEEAKTVSEIFSLKLKGLSNESIANALNQKGSVTKNGNAWTAIAIFRILRNMAYIGYVRHVNSYNYGIHAPIVSEAVFYACLRKRKD